MFSLASPFVRLAGAVLLGAALMLSAYGWGRVEGRQAGERAQLKATVEAVKQREKIDGQVSGLDDYDLCIDAGGLPERCAELRGLGEGAEGQ